MLKNTLIMVVDGVAICATRRKLLADGNIERHGCTVCYEQRGPWIYICDLTQHGMFEDDTRTVVECPHCHSQFFFQYMIPAYDVVIDDEGSSE